MKLNRNILRKMILNEIRQLREGDPMFPRLEKFVDDKYHELTSGESSDPVVSKVQDILNRNMFSRTFGTITLKRKRTIQKK